LPKRRLGLATINASYADGTGLSNRDSSIQTIRAAGCLLRLKGMAQQLPSQRVEVTFVGPPPARQVARASGVTEVKVDGRRLSCLVSGSFQPFLEALRGSEVINVTSPPTPAGGD
jgi:hypothetical protein